LKILIDFKITFCFAPLFLSQSDEITLGEELFRWILQQHEEGILPISLWDIHPWLITEMCHFSVGIFEKYIVHLIRGLNDIIKGKNFWNSYFD
jgi:hypothetical protein